MFKTKRNILLALAVCALLLPATASVKNPVERPFKQKGEHVLVLDFLNYALYGDPMIPMWIEWESGQATHLGLYTSSATGIHNLDTGESNLSGYVTAANGDKVYWESTEQASSPSIIFTGGTGRFEGASGSMISTGTTLSEEWDTDFPWLLRIRSSLSAIGTITY